MGSKISWDQKCFTGTCKTFLNFAVLGIATFQIYSFLTIKPVYSASVTSPSNPSNPSNPLPYYPDDAAAISSMRPLYVESIKNLSQGQIFSYFYQLYGRTISDKAYGPVASNGFSTFSFYIDYLDRSYAIDRTEVYLNGIRFTSTLGHGVFRCGQTDPSCSFRLEYKYVPQPSSSYYFLGTKNLTGDNWEIRMYYKRSPTLPTSSPQKYKRFLIPIFQGMRPPFK
jgi:hypothetical protein